MCQTPPLSSLKMLTASASHSFTSLEDALGAAATSPIATSSARMPACKLRNAWASSRKRSTASAWKKPTCDCAARAILSGFVRAVCQNYALPISTMWLSLSTHALSPENYGITIHIYANRNTLHCAKKCISSGRISWHTDSFLFHHRKRLSANDNTKKRSIQEKIIERFFNADHFWL